MPDSAAPVDRLRLAEPMVALSIATDLAMGQPMEHAMTTAIVATRLAQRANFPPADQRDAYWQALLRYIGCNADVAWLASMAGDDIALRRDMARVDTADDAAALSTLLHTIRASHPEGGVLRAVMHGLSQVPELRASFFPGHCEVASRLAQRLGFPRTLVESIGQLYARWDGKGVPSLKGEAIAPATLAVSLAQDAVVFHRDGGVEALRRMLRERSGRAHAPDLCRVMLEQAEGIFEDLDASPRWDQVLAAEPGETIWLDGRGIDDACEAMGDFADLRSPHHLGHARRVADAAAAGAERLGWDDARRRRVRRAAWLHDLGRCGVPASIAQATGPLTDRQWEQLRLHPYHTQRILARPGPLAELGLLAARHHERLDGTGYPHGLGDDALDAEARLLAAADRWCALREPRPHRVAIDDDAAVRTLQEDVRAGRLCAEAVEAVLGCAVPRPERVLPAGLTDREWEVLRHLARGHTQKQVARTLSLSPKTVDRHVQNIYTKAGVSTRAAATLFAVEHGLLD